MMVMLLTITNKQAIILNKERLASEVLYYESTSIYLINCRLSNTIKGVFYYGKQSN